MFKIFRKIPKLAKNITTLTSLEWFGWGIVETLIPVFVFSIVGNYTQTAIIESIFTITFLISVPFAAVYADRFSLKKMFLLAVLLCIVTGFSYFIASILGSIIFIIFAKFIIGVSTSIGKIARDTAFLRYGNFIGSIFAFFSSLSNIAWLSGIIVSFFIAPILNIKWLFLALVTFNIMAIPLIMNLPEMKAKNQNPIPKIKDVLKNTLKLKAFKYFQKKERFPIFITKIIPSIILVLPTTFLSISSYINSGDIRTAILIGGVSALPAIFSIFMAHLADTSPRKSVLLGFLLLATSLMVFPFANTLLIQLAVAFLAGVGAEIIFLSSMVIIKEEIPEHHLGDVEGSFSVLESLGSILGTILIGFLLDRLNPQLLAFSISILLFSIIIYLSLSWLKNIDSNKKKPSTI